MIFVRMDRIDIKSDIKGDVQIEGYEDWFVAQSFSFGVGREVDNGKGAKTQDVEVGRSSLQSLEIGKSVDSATVYLMQAAMQARSKSSGHAMGIDIHLVQIRETVDASGKSKALKPYMKIRIENAIIKDWSIDGSEDERPTESLTIWFNRAAMKYRATADGKIFQTFGPLGWDQQENKEWKCDALLKKDD